jgi:hypothetical protein
MNTMNLQKSVLTGESKDERGCSAQVGSEEHNPAPERSKAVFSISEAAGIRCSVYCDSPGDLL